MLKSGIIMEVTEAADWCAPMVPVVKKNGKKVIKAEERRHVALHQMQSAINRIRLVALDPVWDSGDNLPKQHLTNHILWLFRVMPLSPPEAPEEPWNKTEIPLLC
ncbi:hypothetical protein QTP70_007281 [Hemibagrus guttatus]|uniref:Uncharacterized protein n=1 Tax=Hemibagrus guttatus TaxID=175788 RepID=A0AAE0V940_9TELE|nr:hypothetical protein QTP70_007281 [Hemibagrus guttatus]